ncbi:MAG: hypothetical protein LBL91_02260 [Lachnospiraceae bacterium]|nr:hypothetical protein [Lachnospiraceae bacterium]
MKRTAEEVSKCRQRMIPYRDEQIFNSIMRSDDYGYTKPQVGHKKYILTNVEETSQRITLEKLAGYWAGTGHVEWEYLMAFILIQEVLKAYEAGTKEADLTELLGRDFSARFDRTFSKEKVWEHIQSSFEIVREDSKNIFLELSA